MKNTRQIIQTLNENMDNRKLETAGVESPIARCAPYIEKSKTWGALILGAIIPVLIYQLFIYAEIPFKHPDLFGLFFMVIMTTSFVASFSFWCKEFMENKPFKITLSGSHGLSLAPLIIFSWFLLGGGSIQFNDGSTYSKAKTNLEQLNEVYGKENLTDLNKDFSKNLNRKEFFNDIDFYSSVASATTDPYYIAKFSIEASTSNESFPFVKQYKIVREQDMKKIEREQLAKIIEQSTR